MNKSVNAKWQPRRKLDLIYSGEKKIMTLITYLSARRTQKQNHNLDQLSKEAVIGSLGWIIKNKWDRKGNVQAKRNRELISLNFYWPNGP